MDLHVWKRKEIENYLIIPKAIYRLTKEPMENYHKFIEKFNEILDAKKEYITDQFSEKLHKYSTELAESTCNRMAREYIKERWKDIDNKIELVGGKSIFREINTWIKSEFGINISYDKIIKEIYIEELDDEILAVIERII